MTPWVEGSSEEWYKMLGFYRQKTRGLRGVKNGLLHHLKQMQHLSTILQYIVIIMKKVISGKVTLP